MKIVDVEGIGPTYQAMLEEQGIETTEQLLDKAGSASGRRSLAAAIGVSEKLALAWVNRADLMRVKGVGEEYSDLLELAGVDTVKELARRNPGNLHAAMQSANETRKVVRRLPSLSEVDSWVAHAKTLPARVTY